MQMYLLPYMERMVTQAKDSWTMQATTLNVTRKNLRFCYIIHSSYLFIILKYLECCYCTDFVMISLWFLYCFICLLSAVLILYKPIIILFILFIYFKHSFTDLYIHYLHLYTSIDSFIHPFTHFIIHLPICYLFKYIIYPFIHSSIHSLIHLSI